ncbi:hypothetical protein QA612_14770 [Evansella sp. AB-P1]|uniref:hypothetical protein n=1 Tax=Evansella sp. AB-P1 TaxID=3037653 RepID=UPI00241C246B|nr:hypothetical protein [Evansella sp. AB-P1]MDG5788736.1 hypothetical protein [Evansella sp. AB-P1]
MRQNRIVLLLPLTVMVFLFIFGYLTINQAQSITNEELNEHIEFQLEVTTNENIPHALGRWNWLDFPEDGMLGHGIIEFIILNENMKPIEFTERLGFLQLLQSSDVIFAVEDSFFTQEGIALTFENDIDENTMFGPKGLAILDLTELDERAVFLEVKYYHTWDEQQYTPIEGEEVIESLEAQGIYQYWVIERSMRLP